MTDNKQTELATGERADVAVAPTKQAVARTWEVTMTPAQTRAALMQAPRVVPRTLAQERARDRVYHDGSVFVDAQDDELVLWARPLRSRLHGGRGRREGVPYPKILRLRIEATASGSRVVARWERHPLTRSLVAWYAVQLMVTVAMAYYVMLGRLFYLAPLMILPLVTNGLRFYGQRAVQRDILGAAYAALAPHELGGAGALPSPFRA